MKHNWQKNNNAIGETVFPQFKNLPATETGRKFFLSWSHYIKRNMLKAMNSLMLAIQMMFSFMITDENSTLKLCKHCGKIFVASRSNVQFCSPQCKNQYNVYKSLAKKEDSE